MNAVARALAIASALAIGTVAPGVARAQAGATPPSSAPDAVPSPPAAAATATPYGGQITVPGLCLHPPICGHVARPHSVAAATTPLPLPAGAVVPAAVAAPWSGARLGALHHDLDVMLAAAPALRGAHVGVLAVDTASGAVLYASRETDEFQPASTTKLVVGSAALDRLGPTYRWRSALSLVALPDGGTTQVFRGGGDPTLAAADVRDAAAFVNGDDVPPLDLLVDDRRYVAPRYPDGWVWDDFGQDYAALASAVSVEENVVHLHVAPGEDVGEPAAVTAEDGIAVVSSATGCADAATSAVVRVRSTVTTVARDAERDVDVTIDRGGCPTVYGTMPLGATAHSIDVAVPSPLLLVHMMLSSVGGRTPAGPDLAGALGTISPPDAERRLRYAGPLGDARDLWSHDSAPLAALLGPNLWIPSDNFVAEMLLDELGYVAGGAPGSAAKGLAYERAWLRSIGVDLDTVTLADGSGLSQYDRLTPVDLVAILRHDWNGPHRDVVLRSLPIGGLRGTIESLTGTPLTGRIFAKTGNMSHVHGLAGYLATQHHGGVTFAFLVDDCNPPYAAVSALRARVLSRIVTAE